MVPEALAFTFVAGVPPLVGLHAAATMALITALFGAQPGVISGAAGATAVVFAPLVAKHGIEYLFAGVVLAGVLQIVAGVCRLGKFIRLVPQPAMLGFVNGLALVIGLAQFEQFAGLSGEPLMIMCGLTALTVAIIKALPKLTQAVPAPLAAILTVTGLTQVLGLSTRTVGDLASIAGSLPAFHLPQVPLSLETLSIVSPFAASVAAVGIIETLLTQSLVDDITSRRTETHVEVLAQGLANIVTGFFAGMGGCAMIGQSIINVSAGGRTRVAGVTCALFLLLYVVAGSELIARIPLAALCGTMFALVFDIFDWTSFKRLRQVPKTDAVVLVSVTAITVFTNLAAAVFSGVIICCVSFAWKAAQRISFTRSVEPNAYGGSTAAVYRIRGPLFFGSVTSFRDALDAKSEPELEVVLDFADSRVWDTSALEAIDACSEKFSAEGKRLHLRHLSPDCRELLRKAGDLVEIDVMDPKYALGVDYPRSILSNLDQTFEERLSSAVQRQYSM